MNIIEILLIGLGISMDAFAVSMGAGSNRSIGSFRSSARLSFHFGLFQFLMPIIGWFIGSEIESYITSIDHWVAFGLLTLIGVRMIRAYFSGNGNYTSDPSKGWNLVTLSIATSIDALAVGLSLAFLKINIFYPCIIFGIITAVFSFTGIRLGIQLGKKLGNIIELTGGLILIVVGIRILSAHIL